LTDPGKRKLSAKQVVDDIRSGMDGTELKQKYSLSDKGLESLCTKLLAAGALTEAEIGRLTPLQNTAKESHQAPAKALWHCPACNIPQATEMAECPACGVIVEKFHSRSERDDHAWSTTRSLSGDTAASERTNWMPIVISILVFIIVGGSLLLWSTHKANKAHQVNPKAQPILLAGTEEDQTEEESNDLESTDKNHKEVETGISKDIELLRPPPVTIPQKTPERTVAPPRQQTPTPREETSSPPQTPAYVTGVLRQFSSGDFKKEVVDASKTYPVLFQFYSQT
jgi:hypothetical protein